jgi:Tol biopolymer transport system component
MSQRRTTGWMAVLLAAFMASAFAGAFVHSDPSQQSAEELYQAALLKKEAEGDLNGAIKLFQDLIAKFPDTRDVAARAQLQIGACYEKLGLKQAQEAYQKVIEKYPEQSNAVMEAREKLALLAKAQTYAPAESREMNVRRVFDDYGPEWGNALSSDGRYLVYTDWSTGDMAVVDLVKKARRHITTDGGLDKPKKAFGETSAFSADDKRVAYGWQGDDRASELRIINFDGTDRQVLYRDENAAWIRPHAWTTDSKSILILLMRKDMTSEIAMFSLADNKIKIVRKVVAKDPEMALSPDGKLIAYSMAPERGSAKRDIFIMNTDGSKHEALVSNPADDYLLGWSPDGRWVVFASDRSGATGVWAVAIKSGRAEGSPVWLKSDLTPTPVRLTPDGTLNYMHMEVALDVFTAPIDPGTGRQLGVPTAVRSQRTGIRTGPDWSPDGRRLAYKYFSRIEERTQGQAQISIFDFEEGEELQIATDLSSGNPYLGPHWAPDGRSVLLVGSRAPEESGIYQVDIPGGASKLLVKFPPQKYCFQTAWAPDGKSIFYTLGNPSKVLRRDLETGQDYEFATMQGAIGLPRMALSPDGKWLAFTSMDTMTDPRKLMIAPAAGGDAREIYRTNGGDFPQWIIWTVDGREIWLKIYRPAPDGKGQPKVDFLSVSPDGQNVRELEFGVKQERDAATWPIMSAMDLRLHPNGRQVAFWTGQSKLELWALENFLPKKK